MGVQLDILKGRPHRGLNLHGGVACGAIAPC